MEHRSGRAALMLIALAMAAMAANHLAVAHHVLDDAYITFRFAQNFTETGQLTWNIGQDPVEGFTSFLWTVLMAAGFGLGAEPVFWARTLSLLALLALALWLVWASRGFALADRVVLLAASVISPILMLHASQGMETAAAGVILFWASLQCWRIGRDQDPGFRQCLLLFGLLLLGCLARPEAALFAAAMSVGLLALVLARPARVLPRLLAAAALMGALGAAYFLWRMSYFGYALPNAAYLKSEPGLKLTALKDLRNFVGWMLAPALIYALLRSGPALGRTALRPLLPIVGAIAVLLAFYATINPIQGFLYRFPIITLPPAILVIWAILREAQASRPSLRSPASVAAAMILGLALSSHGDIAFELDRRSQADRVTAGRALAGLDGTMFVSEAGALPFYAGWEAHDHLGLVTEQVMHGGLDCLLFDSWDPDLAMFIAPEVIPFGNPYIRPAIECMARPKAEFRVVAITRKGDGLFHVYFARAGSPIYDEIFMRLNALPDVAYGDPARMLAESPIPPDPRLLDR